MPSKLPVLLCLLACTPLYGCSDNSGTQTNPAIAGAGGVPTTAGAAGTPAAGTGGAPTMSSGSAGRSTGAAGSTAAGSGSAGMRATSGGSGGAGTGAVSGAAGVSGAPAAAGSGATAGTSSEPGGPFEMCTASLKGQCAYADKETACSGIMTAMIPLTNGQTWGNTEIKLGPYGGYVEWNQGQMFANPVNAAEDTCAFIASTFGEPQSTTDDILNLRGGDLSLYTIFRPACMKDGEKYPVITWGNGTCGQSGGYAALNITLASYGFVVISANSRYTNAGNNEMLRALDLAKALNEDTNSKFYQKLDLDKVGAMGHSQGGAATVNAAMDPRVKSAIVWNADLSAPKPFLAVSGERDISGQSAAQMMSGVNGASQPGAWLYYHKVLETGGNFTGHLTLMEQPERVTDMTIAWWKYQLNGDAEAKKMFVGADCGLCNKKDEYEYGVHNLQ